MAARQPRGPPRTGDSRPPRPPLLKIALKIINPTEPKPTRNDVFKTVCVNLKGFLTRLNDTHSGFTAYSDLPETIDNMTSPKGLTELTKINLQPVTPPEIKAKRTVFMRGLDYDIVKHHTTDEIRDELMTRQPWLTNLTVFKIKEYTHLLKVTCGDNGQADRIIRDGLMAFHTRIPPHSCTLEKFTPILICYNCYKYDSHISKQCPQPPAIVCSECAQSGHTHRECTSLVKKCLNCPPPNNNHRTFAPLCPYKKKAIRDKNQRLNDEKDKATNKTYSDIVKTTIKETAPTPRPTINLTDKTNFKLVALIIEAHIAAITTDKPYNDILSESLRLNYDLDVKFPDRDSQKILDMYLTPNQPPTTTSTTMTEIPTLTDNRKMPPLTDQSSESEMDDGEGVGRQPLGHEQWTQMAPPLPQRHPGQGRKKKRSKNSPDPQPETKLPKRDTIPRRRTTSETSSMSMQEGGSRPQFTYRVFRSEEDPSPLPDELTAEWFTEQIINKSQYGLKIHVNGDFDAFKKYLRDERLTPIRDHIRTIDDDTFRKYHRIMQYGPISK